MSTGRPRKGTAVTPQEIPRIIRMLKTEMQEEIPFIPAFDLLETQALAPEEAAAIGAALYDLSSAHSETTERFWCSAARIDSVSRRLNT